MIPKIAAESPCVREHNWPVLGGQAEEAHLQKLQGIMYMQCLCR